MAKWTKVMAMGVVCLRFKFRPTREWEGEAIAEPKFLRRRLLNHWSVMRFHRILEMKARAFGVPLVFVDPQGTSKTCPICGGSLRGQERVCPSCGLSRHYVAAINIACRGEKNSPVFQGWGRGSWETPVARSLVARW